MRRPPPQPPRGAPPPPRPVAAFARPPHIVLGVPEGAPLADVRAAWRAAAAAAHPDVGGDEGKLLELNLAYAALTGSAGRGSAAAARADASSADPFLPSAEPPSIPFVDPFAFDRIDPLRWRELQALARAPGDAAAALRAAGLPPAPGAVAVVTPAQAQALDDMLADWEAGALAGGYVACDEIAARVADALLRARAANAAWVRRR